jgi:hypothetical protein
MVPIASSGAKHAKEVRPILPWSKSSSTLAAIVGTVRRYLVGSPADATSLATDDIRRVDVAGRFFASGHTFENFRGAIFEPRLTVTAPPALPLREDLRGDRRQDGSVLRDIRG